MFNFSLRFFARGLLRLALAIGTGSALALPLDLEVPQISLAGVRVLQLTPSTQTFALSLRVRNPNMMDIPLHSLSYQLEFNGEHVLQGRRDKPVTLPGGGETTVDLRADASLQEVIHQLQQMANTGNTEAKYRLHGEFRLGNGSTAVPYEQSGRIDLRDVLGAGSGHAKQPSKPEYI